MTLSVYNPRASPQHVRSQCAGFDAALRADLPLHCLWGENTKQLQVFDVNDSSHVALI